MFYFNPKAIFKAIIKYPKYDHNNMDLYYIILVIIYKMKSKYLRIFFEFFFEFVNV